MIAANALRHKIVTLLTVEEGALCRSSFHSQMENNGGVVYRGRCIIAGVRGLRNGCHGLQLQIRCAIERWHVHFGLWKNKSKILYKAGNMLEFAEEHWNQSIIGHTNCTVYRITLQ